MYNPVRDAVLELPVGSVFTTNFGGGEFEKMTPTGVRRTSNGENFDLNRSGLFSMSSFDGFQVTYRPDKTDAEPETYARYQPSMFPMFKVLADAADAAGYCGEYDHLAALVEAPTRAEIKALTPKKTYLVKVPILSSITMEVEAEDEAEAIKLSDGTFNYRREWENNRGNAPLNGYGYRQDPDQVFSGRVTAVEVKP